MHKLSLRISGFVSSLILTLLAYFVITNRKYFNFSIKESIIVIFVFAIIQSIAQLIFFIDMWKEKKTFWNLSVFVSTVAIIFIVIFFSIWIINHLNYHMH